MLEPSFIYRAKYLKVRDGDTAQFWVDLGLRSWRKEWIRILGLDTPEKIKATMPEWKEAGDLLHAILSNANEIVIQTLPDKHGEEKSNFDRWLGRVFVSGQDVAELMTSSHPTWRSDR